MPRNGSGTFSLYTPGNPVVTGTTISSTDFNNTTSDIATGLTNSIAKDGQTVPTANLPMGGFKHTNLGSGSAATDSLNLGQAQGQSYLYLASVAGTDTITASTSPVTTSYAAGQTYRFVAANTNTGAVTININSLGAEAVTKSGTTALAAGDIVSGGLYQITYDGTQFQIANFETIPDESITPAKLSDDAFISIIGNSKNLIITNNSGTPNSQVDIDADEIILKDSSGRAYLAQSVNLTANIAASGANGLDTGAEANSTWYYLWVIYNGTTVASLISASSTAPTLPSGYTYKALVGACYNNSSSNFSLFRQVGKSAVWREQRTLLSGTVTTLAWTSVSTSSVFPPTAAKVTVSVGAGVFGLSPNSDGYGGDYGNNGGSAANTAFGGIFTTATTVRNTLTCQFSGSLYYFLASTPQELTAIGWEYQ